MLFSAYQLGFGGGETYAANAVNFDGTNDYLLRGADLTGSSDGKVGTISFWFKTGASANDIVIHNTGSGFNTQKNTNDEIQVIGENSSGTIILNIETVTTVDDDAWHHFISSWDLAAGTTQIYLDGSSDITQTTATDDTIDYTKADWAVGGSVTGGLLWNGCMADLWVDISSYLNIATISNRRKFITAGKKPVSLGSDGSRPTGTAPIIFFSGPTSTWHTNLGGGGGFTETGALTDCATTP